MIILLKSHKGMLSKLTRHSNSSVACRTLRLERIRKADFINSFDEWNYITEGSSSTCGIVIIEFATLSDEQ